jgi:hypothetical protein
LKKLFVPNLHLALVHHPVVNKSGDVIAAAVTNLDLHDIARAARTYAVGSLYVVTPLDDQRQLVERVLDHWLRGAGAVYNPKRRQALELIRIRETLEGVIEDIRIANAGTPPKTIVTSARNSRSSISYGRLRRLLQEDRPYLLIFGTAWGLAQSVISGADYMLAPVMGNMDYNHLSVRSAAAIILDRLVGRLA